MMLRTRAFVSIGLVLIGLALGLGLIADPLLRRTLREHRELAARLDSIRRDDGGEPAPSPAVAGPPASGAPADLAAEEAAVERLWTVVALACLLAPLTAGVALHALLAPIAALRRACERLPQFQSGPPLDEGRTDELGRLCAAFDRMRGRLEQGRRRRQRHHDDLEAMVVEKTRQLAATVDRLRSLDQMKDSFLGCAARELEAPVRSIAAACDDLDRAASPERRRELLRRILSECRHVDQMTRDVLDFVRTSAEGLTYRFEPTTIDVVLRRALASVRERMPRSDVEVALARLEDGTVVWDGRWISRILESILMHVVQRAPGGAVVVVDTRLEGPDVRIELRFDRPASAPAAAPVEPGRIGQAVWTPVVERHLGEWSERDDDDRTSLVVVLPTLAEHLRWPEPAQAAGAGA